MSAIMDQALQQVYPDRMADCLRNDEAMRTMTRAYGVRCLNTGKVLIGCAYQPKPPAPSTDAEQIQAALLAQREAGAQNPLRRLVGAIARWL